MCGIAGILSTDNDLDSALFRKRIEVMQRALLHRGPDGHGTFFAPSGHAALCHTRLAIIDLSEAGKQPMQSACGRYTISFNGEIYNYQALRAELKRQGETFSSTTDTEVLLKLYQHEGTKCVDKLRGMFAFLIWDELEHTAFAARDPLGIKPLYYTHEPKGKFGFSSELRSLVKAELAPSSICPEGLNSYFLRGTVAEPNTLLKQIRLLPAGHHLTWSKGKVKIHRYWQPIFRSTPKTRDESVKQTRSALESSVKAHLVSDVPVGVFLSGGIDSSVLVALASAQKSTQINTYSIAFESPEWNEGEIAKRVANHFGTNHTEFLITPEIAQPLFEEFLSVIDQPTIDGFNTFCVAKFAREHGEKVVLSGVGSDELFAGYKSFHTLPTMLKWSNYLRYFAPLSSWINATLGKWLPSKLQRTLDFLSRPGDIKAAHQSLRGIYSEIESQHLCELYNVTRTQKETTLLNVHSASDAISLLELTHYMRNQLLRDSDVMSMACGLELRVPFVDRDLVETLTDIPAAHRLEYGKRLLIDAVPELPDWVVNRPKQGFRFPFDEWFSNDWQKLTQRTQPPPWIKLAPWYKRWSLLVLDHWTDSHLKAKS